MKPHAIAVIPARGGSKGVPGKNLRLVGGRPLVTRAVEACQAAANIDAVFVSTDDLGIAVTAVEAGAAVVARPTELAGDTASSESALLDALDQLARLGVVADVLVFVQCTSPFIDPRDLEQAVAMVTARVADTVFAAVPTYDFLWRSNGAQRVVGGLNHRPDIRARRQDRAPDYRETGAFYVMGTAGFQAHRHRFFGRTAVVEVAALGAVEIDTEDDLLLAEALVPVVESVLVDG